MKYEDLFKILKILPSDYTDYGGSVKRWENENENYPDCSCGCKFFIALKDPFQYDWGVCSNPNSPRAGLLTWEHQAGKDCFVQEDSTLDQS